MSIPQREQGWAPGVGLGLLSMKMKTQIKSNWNPPSLCVEEIYWQFAQKMEGNTGDVYIEKQQNLSVLVNK